MTSHKVVGQGVSKCGNPRQFPDGGMGTFSKCGVIQHEKLKSVNEFGTWKSLQNMKILKIYYF